MAMDVQIPEGHAKPRNHRQVYLEGDVLQFAASGLVVCQWLRRQSSRTLPRKVMTSRK